MEIKNRDIVIVGLQAWDVEIGSNCKNLAAEFAKNNRVLYVNSPMDRLTILRKKNDPKIAKRIRYRKERKNYIDRISDSMWNLYPDTILESINQLGVEFLFDKINKINNRRFAKTIKQAITDLGFKDIILFNDSDMFRSYHLKELLKPSVYAYYTRDNLISVDYWKLNGVRVEAKHMAKADVVLANSTYLRNVAEPFNKHSYFVGQGCDVSMFDLEKKHELPEDIKNIQHPMIGYIGVLKSLRLEIEIIETIARSNPEWQVVLIGPEDESFKSSILHQLPNVHFLGNKNEAELPAYLSTFDVAINPQKLNPTTIGNYPRKIDEYLAMGKATVATRTEAMSYFKNYCYLAKNAEEYVIEIEKALAEDNTTLQQERSVFAKEHTWENNALEVYKYVTEAEERNKL